MAKKPSYEELEQRVKELENEALERKRVEEALRESEERFSGFAKASGYGLAMGELSGRLVFGNSAILRIVEEEREADFTAKTFYQYYSEKDKKLLRTDILPIVMAKGHWKGEIPLLTTKGNLTPTEQNIFLISDEHGAPRMVGNIITDITERKQAEEEKKKLQTQLQQAQKMKSIGTLAGGIAHDFNNILFPIVGYAEMMLDDLPEDSPHKNNTNEILQGAKRATDLVKQILTFSRQADQELKPLKVQLIIKEVLKLIRSSLPSTIEIKQHISNECGLVMADATQIHQVAMNLMTNAYHAMEDEGGKLEVTLKGVELEIDDLKDQSMTPGAYVCLTVADTGPGMDQSVISRIFEPYFTTKEERKGTGLGLAVVHGIVKSYKGDVRVYSEPGEGTAFHVYLPAIQSESEKEEIDAVAPVQEGTERILLVDDEESIVSMETQMLERLGYHVTARTSSIEALEAFRAAPDKFDLVITDMTMPNMTGVQLSQKLMEIRSNIPIIICTGFSEQISEDKVKAIGIRRYVMKPVVMREIAKKIREVLDHD